MNRFLFIILLLTLVISGCDKKEKQINKFSDPVIQKIYDLKDRRASDSLSRFVSNENAVYRYEAVLAFGSLQDSSVIAFIGKAALHDTDTMVRRAAVFSLGQTPSRQSASLLEQAIASEKSVSVRNEILEAYGKTAKHWKPLVDPNRPETKKGLAWSFYRAGLNGRVDAVHDAEAAALLDKNNENETRLAIAHFFARGAQKIESLLTPLSKAAESDPLPEVRMASVLALRKIKTDSSRTILEKIFKSEKDYRVKVNTIRALQSFPLAKTKDLLFSALNDKNANVSVAASEAIRISATEADWIDLANRVNEIRNWRSQANVYKTIVNVKENQSVVNEIKTKYQSAQQPYQKAALLEALDGSTANYFFIENELLTVTTPVVKLAAANALVSIVSNPKSTSTTKEKFVGTAVKAFEAGDAAVIGTLSQAFADSTLGFRSIVKDFGFLKTARQKLSLPKDSETIQPLDAAIAYFEKRKLPPVKNEFNHPIDWNFVKSIPVDQRAVIRTSRGTITLNLFVEEAPGSVANFVSLAKNKYFDHKVFHRVVPNFVIQTGSDRGDGWGSDEYSIRSEFYFRKYKSGSVGMASAGKDTEGSQWFITHSPTPHLDGRYTIFAEVESGLEVVDLIEVGDEIIDVKIENANPK